MSKSTRRFLLVAALVLVVTVPGGVLTLLAGQTVLGFVLLAGAGSGAAQLARAASEGMRDE
jgi:hypothetical protein